jgi:UDP-glucuronate 4-epimerase
MTDDMKILVTGGAGFIGSHVSERLVQRGDRICILDNFNDSYDPAIKRANIQALADSSRAKVVVGDVRDQVLLADLFAREDFDAVVHLAAMAGVRPSLKDPLLYADVNIRGTQLILSELEERPRIQMVFASSSSIYGMNEKVPFSEDDRVPTPVSPYAASKRAGELFCCTHQHLYGNDVSCLRFFTVYGPRQRPEMAIHRFVRNCLEGEPIPFFGDGSSRRDYTYIDDIVQGVLGALDHSSGFAIFNLGESQTIALSELVETIGEICGVEPVLDRRPAQPGDVPLTFADITKARRSLGYEPRVPLHEGLRRFLGWYRDQSEKLAHSSDT